MLTMSINWRLASRLSVVTFAVLVVIIIAVFQQRRAAPALPTNGNGTTNPYGLQGTDLNGTVAPGFQLTDQNGKTVSLADFKGKPVIITFMYTHCPDVCPVTAEKLHSALQSLGAQGQDVGILAVSTDPKRDTTAAALDFSKAHGMQDSWHYLVGKQDELSKVWSSYSIYAQTQQQSVNHSMGIYLIDKQGHEQVFMNEDFTPKQLVDNLKILLKA